MMLIDCVQVAYGIYIWLRVEVETERDYPISETYILLIIFWGGVILFFVVLFCLWCVFFFFKTYA